MKLNTRTVFPLVLISLALLNACATSTENNEIEPVAGSAKATPVPLPDVAPLINQLALQGGCKDSTAEMRLTFTGENGQREQLDFRVQRRYAPDQVATLLTVLAPREETSKSLLMYEKPDQPTEAISYLAGLKSLTRFGSDRILNFRGSRSAIQELLGLELKQYAIEKTERVSEGSEALIKVEMKEEKLRRLAFPRLLAFFKESSQGLEPARFELQNSRGETLKIVRVAEYKNIQGYPTITRVEIEDKEQKRNLELTTRDIKYDRALAPAIFTEDNLIKTVTEASKKLVQ